MQILNLVHGTYRLVKKYSVRNIRGTGEFNFKPKFDLGSVYDVKEYVCDNQLLIEENYQNESLWSVAEYVHAEVIRDAFKIPLKLPTSITINQVIRGDRFYKPITIASAVFVALCYAFVVLGNFALREVLINDQLTLIESVSNTNDSANANVESDYGASLIIEGARHNIRPKKQNLLDNYRDRTIKFDTAISSESDQVSNTNDSSNANVASDSATNDAQITRISSIDNAKVSRMSIEDKKITYHIKSISGFSRSQLNFKSKYSTKSWIRIDGSLTNLTNGKKYSFTTGLQVIEEAGLVYYTNSEQNIYLPALEDGEYELTMKLTSDKNTKYELGVKLINSVVIWSDYLIFIILGLLFPAILWLRYFIFYLQKKDDIDVSGYVKDKQKKSALSGFLILSAFIGCIIWGIYAIFSGFFLEFVSGFIKAVLFLFVACCLIDSLISRINDLDKPSNKPEELSISDIILLILILLGSIYGFYQEGLDWLL